LPRFPKSPERFEKKDKGDDPLASGDEVDPQTQIVPKLTIEEIVRGAGHKAENERNADRPKRQPFLANQSDSGDKEHVGRQKQRESV